MPNNNKIKLFEVEDMGIWNNFKNICYVLEDLKDDIKNLSHEIKEQQKQIIMLSKGLEATVVDAQETKIKNTDLPRWLKHETPDNIV